MIIFNYLKNVFILLLMAPGNFLLLTFFPMWVGAQVPHKDSLQRERYIEPMARFITLKLSQSSEVEILGVNDGQNKVELFPNVKSTTHLSFAYRFIFFSLKYSPKFLPGNDDDAIRGVSKVGGFSFGFNFRHWQQELSFSKTKGYYLSNTKDFDPDWTNGQPYTQFPQLVYSNYEGITGYNFNPNFSVAAAATQSARQLRSAGSFIPIALYRYYKIDDKTALTGNQTSQRSNNFEFLLGAGYHYTYVLKEAFYISAGATPGVGFVYSRLFTRSVAETIRSTQNNAIFRLSGRAGIGYNGPRFFIGAYMRFSVSDYKEEGTQAIVNNDRITLQGFIGYRLNAPKWMRENVDKISAKAGMK